MDPFRWDFVGKNLFCMAVEGFVYFIFNLVIQYNFFLDLWWGLKDIINILWDSAQYRLLLYNCKINIKRKVSCKMGSV